MSETYDLERDLREAEAMAESLVPYVHNEPLYGSVGGFGFFAPSTMPSLTIGALLMRLRRLNALCDQMNESQEKRLDAAAQRNADVYSEWKVHYHKKLIREANSRLDAMKTFFDECRSNPPLCGQIYRPEVMRRTIVEEIFTAMDELGINDEALSNKANATDSQLRRFVRSSDFIWDRQLQSVYPEYKFWWLYHHPPE